MVVNANQNTNAQDASVTRNNTTSHTINITTSVEKRVVSKRASFATSTPSNSSGFLMKLLPHRRRQSEVVKKTSFILDDYANVLSRDSNFLTMGDSATVTTNASATTSLNESVKESSCSSMNATPMARRPSVVAVANVGSFQRQEVELGALLGKGSFCKVYEIQSIDIGTNGVARDTSIDDEELGVEDARATMSKNARQGKYAMKRLRKKLLRRPRDFTKAAANLVLEAQYLSKLDHPNILKLRGSALDGASSFQSGQHDGYFLILDRVTETLQERIHKTWAAQREAKKPIDHLGLMYQKTHYSLQIASAICHLHERRIIFRDLKPGNLGFTDDHSINLFDFGLARELPPALGLTNELFHMTQNAGTQPYQAVEVATNGLYNAKADVYSWSMVVYELMMERLPFVHLAGSAKKPFANRDFYQAVYVDGERPSFELEEGCPISAAPANLQELVAKCWQADVFRRPTMDDVYGDLQAILEGLPGAKANHVWATPPAPKVSGMVLSAQNRTSFNDLSENSQN